MPSDDLPPRDAADTPRIPAAPGGESARAAVVDLREAMARRDEWRAAGQRVVLTNGCFDLLHVGHVRYLDAAQSLGDRLIVAVNDDASTRALKGPGRPLVPVGERAEVLGALRSVDLVVPFRGRTASAVVAALRPDVYAKGGDYGAPGRLPPEADVAAGLGGEVAFLPYTAGASTTALLDRAARRP